MGVYSPDKHNVLLQQIIRTLFRLCVDSQHVFLDFPSECNVRNYGHIYAQME